MNTHNIPFLNIKQKIILNYPKSASMGFFQGTKNEFETAVVNEPSVFEPLTFYCISYRNHEIPTGRLGFESLLTTTPPSQEETSAKPFSPQRSIKKKFHGTMLRLISLYDPSDRATRLRCANTLRYIQYRYRSLEIHVFNSI